jgi:hypothetical protein
MQRPLVSKREMATLCPKFDKYVDSYIAKSGVAKLEDDDIYAAVKDTLKEYFAGVVRPYEGYYADDRVYFYFIRINEEICKPENIMHMIKKSKSHKKKLKMSAEFDLADIRESRKKTFFQQISHIVMDGLRMIVNYYKENPDKEPFWLTADSEDESNDKDPFPDVSEFVNILAEQNAA